MNQKIVNGPAVKGSFGKKPIRLCYCISRDFKGLFTWRWGTPGAFKWGNPPVHIISHFNLITFTWYCDRWSDPPPSQQGVKFCHVNVSRWGNLPGQGQIHGTSNSRKIHFDGGFASLLKVTIESHSIEDGSKSSKWVYKSINRQKSWFSRIFLVYVLSDHSVILRKCTPGWRGCSIACNGGLFFYPT